MIIDDGRVPFAAVRVVKAEKKIHLPVYERDSARKTGVFWEAQHEFSASAVRCRTRAHDGQRADDAGGAFFRFIAKRTRANEELINGRAGRVSLPPPSHPPDTVVVRTTRRPDEAPTDTVL